MMTPQSLTQTLHQQRLIEPPKFVPERVHYETQVGSVAYGVSQQRSDLDVCGFCVPPREVVFPHLAGEIPGFGRQLQRFDQFQKHGLVVTERDEVIDLTIYNITRFVSLCMENNPNMIEALFTPQRCVLYASELGTMMRERRHVFLHKGAYHKFLGFAHSQRHKMRHKQPEGKRAAIVQEHGYDVKFAYHAVRLLDEAEQLLAEGDLDLERGRERLIAIRSGAWTMAQVEQYCDQQEAALGSLYETSALAHSPDEASVKALLLDCLEQAWGSLEGCGSFGR